MCSGIQEFVKVYMTEIYTTSKKSIRVLNPSQNSFIYLLQTELFYNFRIIFYNRRTEWVYNVLIRHKITILLKSNLEIEVNKIYKKSLKSEPLEHIIIFI